MSAAIVVVRASGLFAVQDGGRAGHMHEGVPRGGALVPELLARANALVGNAWDAPAIEMHGAITLRAERDVRAATELGAISLPSSAPVAIARARYLAIEGGFEAPEILGGRGALLGFSRAIATGDRLTHGSARGASRDLAWHDDPHATIRVLLGPDHDAFAPDAVDELLGRPFTVSPSSDRAGMRLVGPTLRRASADDGESAPMVRGAIQVPQSGEPIVLGPDHPTTGGYPVIAAVVRADHGRLAARAPGSVVRFVPVTLEEARAAWREHRRAFFA